MRRPFAKLIFGAFALAAPLFAANTASAADCAWLGYGTAASLDCEVVTSGGCTAECTPLNVTAQCGFSCQDNCHATVSESCTTTCEDTCKTKCDPGELDCAGYCETDCKGHCSEFCAKDGNGSDCEEKCEGSCQSECGVSCHVKPPSCTTMCQESCQGSCHAQVNFKCEVDCEGGCTDKVTGGCKTSCSAPEGALFCNGQYVEVDDVVACSTAFVLDVNVDCSGNECTATATCATAPPGSAPIDFAAIGAMIAGCGIIVSRRRNRANKK